MGLHELGLRPYYRSDENDLVKELFIPALSESVEYGRAVGYFTSSSLESVSAGLECFVKNGGSIRLVASPYLDPGDVADLERGYELREIVERSTMRELEEPKASGALGVLGRLVAEGRLEIRLALVTNGSSVGMYHEKIGYFRDRAGDQVAISGSANETYRGLLANFESVEVFRGWQEGDSPRVSRIVRDFERLWRDETPNLTVLDFPEASRLKLIEIADSAPYRQVPKRSETRTHLRPPPGLTQRPYQKQAVEAWLRNQGRGMLKMATGTGKTKTALFAAAHIASLYRERERPTPLVVVIVVPYQNLVDQWLEEVHAFGVSGVGIYESRDQWLPRAQRLVDATRLGRDRTVVLVSTVSSFRTEAFQSLLSHLELPMVLIADEVHNINENFVANFLPSSATYRMALSATPERWLDDDGTAALVEYFGPVVFELGLGDAIEMGALCHYNYYPRLVELTGEENLLYSDLSRAIGRLIAQGERPDEERSPLGALLRKRAAVLGHASGKLPLLRDDVHRRQDAAWQLAYCAEGARPVDGGYADEPGQVDQVVALIGGELRLPIHKYVSSTSRPDRRRVLERFGSGRDLKFLAAMRCLDEGVDIPDARVAYILASSSNPRQFIQRRGRLLRPAPGKERAEILDYIAVPPPSDEGSFDVERKLLRRELQRVSEFAQLADNYAHSVEALRPLRVRYGLLDT